MYTTVRLESCGAYWRAAWPVGPYARKRVLLGPKSELSRAAAIRKCRELAVRMGLGEKPGHKAPGLREWCDRVIEGKTDAREATITDLKFSAVLLAEVIGADTRIDQVTTDHARQFRTALEGRTFKRSKRKGAAEFKLATNTIRKHLRNARAIFAAAVEADHIRANPFRLESTAVVDVGQHWRMIDEPTLRRMMDAAPHAGARALLALCRWAGLRLNEALRLRWQHVDLAAGVLRIHPPPNNRGEAAPTTKHRYREVPIEPRLRAALQEAFDTAPQGTVSVCRVGSSVSAQALMRAILRISGVPPYPQAFHALRKSRESEWMAEYPVLTVAAWMGHDPAVAQKHYVKPLAEQVAAVVTPQGTAGDEVAELKAQVAQLTSMLAKLAQHLPNPA